MQPIHFLTAGCSELPHRDGSSNGVRSSVVLLISINTETAPNSSTGSGRFVFPRADGVVSSFPPGGIWKRGVPETSPCHIQAKQSGELDPRKVTMDCRERSRGIETSTELVVGSRNASAQFVNSFCTWAASAGSCERKPAVTDAPANQIE